jgi:hypothetical protein
MTKYFVFRMINLAMKFKWYPNYLNKVYDFLLIC